MGLTSIQSVDSSVNTDADPDANTDAFFKHRFTGVIFYTRTR